MKWKSEGVVCATSRFYRAVSLFFDLVVVYSIYGNYPKYDGLLLKLIGRLALRGDSVVEQVDDSGQFIRIVEMNFQPTRLGAGFSDGNLGLKVFL